MKSLLKVIYEQYSNIQNVQDYYKILNNVFRHRNSFFILPN